MRPVSYKSIHDIFTAHRIVEGFVISEACNNIRSEDFEYIEKIIGEQAELSKTAHIDELVEKDWEFHKTIYDCYNNETLNGIIIMLWSQMRQAKSLAQIDTTWGRKWGKVSVERHRRILEALHWIIMLRRLNS